jgi:hypothetical protein
MPHPSLDSIIEDTAARDAARKAYILKEYGSKPSANILLNAVYSFNAGWEAHRQMELAERERLKKERFK